MDAVLDALDDAAARAGMDIGITERRKPDKTWAIQVLHYFEPNHRFFAKKFIAKKLVEPVKVDNHDGFFDDLPIGPRKKRVGGIFKEDPREKIQRKIAQNQERLLA